MDQALRVLHVVTHMNRGGLETMIMNYYRKIDRNKVQFDFLTHRSDEKDYDKEIESLGGRIYNLPPLNPLSLKYRSSLKKFFEEHQEYSIVHCHLDTMSASALRYARKYEIPVRIAHSHTANQVVDYKYPVRMIARSLIPSYANKLFACGKDAGEWMFPNKKFITVRNAIDLSEYVYNPAYGQAKKVELGIENRYVIGHVGSFSTPKNHDFLIDAFRHIVIEKPESLLMLVGAGGLEAKIREKIKLLGLEDFVVFLGQRTDVPEFLQAMDLFMFPSLYEGVPTALIEAQASGLPCIVSDRISSEVCMASNITSLSLRNSMEWANVAIEESKKINRVDNIGILKLKGYDIKENVSWLGNFYIEAAKRSNNP